ncbi:MAG: hypothetical protein WCQ50_10875 [Spirochaetota bacterium]
MSDGMDPKKASDALIEAVQSSFAEMAFIDVVVDSSNAEVPQHDRAAIDIMKPVSLRLEISASPGLRSRISDTLFGDMADRQKDDAFLELVNVAAGVFLSAYYGSGSEVRLELPRYLFGDDDIDGSLVTELKFNAEGEPIIAAIRSVRYRY